MCVVGWMDKGMVYSLEVLTPSLFYHPFILIIYIFSDMVTPFFYSSSLFFLGHTSLASHLFLWGNHSLTPLFISGMLPRESLPSKEHLFGGWWWC